MASDVKGEDRFSFRWGIPWLDVRFVQVPTFFFRHYGEVGITRTEFLMVLHMATYKFEARGSVARPSLVTVAASMGLCRRHVERLCRSLEEKGLLRVRGRPGKTSEYNFEKLARALLEREVGGKTRDTHVGGDGSTPDAHVGGPPTPMSPEEEEPRRTPRGGGGGHPDQELIEELAELGVVEGVARELVAERGAAAGRAWLDYVEEARGVVDAAALWVARMRDGEIAPKAKRRSRRGAPYADRVFPECVDH